RSDVVPHHPGGPRERRQAFLRTPCRCHGVLHGRRSECGHPGRRMRFRSVRDTGRRIRVAGHAVPCRPDRRRRGRRVRTGCGDRGLGAGAADQGREDVVTDGEDVVTDADEITVLIVDDHPVVRDGLRGMFAASPEFDVVGEAASGPEAVTLTLELDPDVVLMDLRMPGGGGVQAITELVARGARSRVLVLTTYDTDADTVPAIEAGATGYLLKDAMRDDLFAGVRAAAEGRTVLSP